MPGPDMGLEYENGATNYAMWRWYVNIGKRYIERLVADCNEHRSP